MSVFTKGGRVNECDSQFYQLAGEGKVPVVQANDFITVESYEEGVKYSIRKSAILAVLDIKGTTTIITSYSLSIPILIADDYEVLMSKLNNE